MKLNLIAALALAAPAAAFAENVWTYYAPTEEGNPTNVACIVKDDWILSVCTDYGRISFYPDAGTVTLHQSLAGEGVLDLRDVSVAYTASDGSEARTEITGLSFKVGYPWENFNTCLATEVYANNLVRLPEFCGAKSLRKAWLSGDQVTEMPDGYRGFKNCSSLTNVVLVCPNLKNVLNDFLGGAPVTNGVSEVCPPSVASIGQGAFSNGPMITGSLVMTNCMGGLSGVSSICATNMYFAGPYSGKGSTIVGGGVNGSGTLEDQIFRGWGVVESVTFKWPNVRMIAGGYASIGKLREITIDMPAITNVLANMFSGAYNLEKLTVLGATVPTNVVDELLKSVPHVAPDAETTTRWAGYSQTRGRAILYCSKKQGWKALAKPLTAGTYEKEHAPVDCFGVWETAAGERKAWMVHLPQDTDPRTGAVIVVR